MWIESKDTGDFLVTEPPMNEHASQHSVVARPRCVVRRLAGTLPCSLQLLIGLQHLDEAVWQLSRDVAQFHVGTVRLAQLWNVVFLDELIERILVQPRDAVQCGYLIQHTAVEIDESTPTVGG